MNTKKSKVQNVRTVMVSILICLLFIPSGYSSMNEGEEIFMGGSWSTSSNENTHSRSLPIIPITASLFDYYIQILNEAPDCDITVTITHCQTGEVVRQQNVPEVATSCFTIPITDLVSGEYLLELTGPGKRNLKGTFNK